MDLHECLHYVTIVVFDMNNRYVQVGIQLCSSQWLGKECRSRRYCAERSDPATDSHALTDACEVATTMEADAKWSSSVGTVWRMSGGRLCLVFYSWREGVVTCASAMHHRRFKLRCFQTGEQTGQ